MHKRVKILFLSMRNDCRSLMCEAMCRQLAGDYLEVASAGISPVREAHPKVAKYLGEVGIRPAGLKPRSTILLEDYEPDLIISVNPDAMPDKVQEDTRDAPCLSWPLPDPAAAGDDEAQQADAFRESITQIGNRVKELFMAQRQGLLDSAEKIQLWSQRQ